MIGSGTPSQASTREGATVTSIPIGASAEDDGRRDFDFIFGRWQVHNRKLADIADPDCTSWVEFGATNYAEPIFGGLGHIDRIWADAPPGGQPLEGFTLRLFDPSARLWRIWWAASTRPGRLDPPVEGSWEAGRGRFTCDDVIGEHPVKVRFDWTSETPVTARWEQAFSYDSGATWHTNWIMDLRRVTDEAPASSTAQAS
jgi:hypothetical protein